MNKQFAAALVALSLSGFALAQNCTRDMPDRVIPQAGDKGIAMFAEETVKEEYRPPKKMAERQFDHAVGMWNAVTAYPCDRGRPANIEFQSFEIVRLDPSTGKLIPELTLRFDGTGGSSFDGGGQWHRSPEWFISGQPERQPTVASTRSSVFMVDLKSIPKAIVHMWTSRTPAMAGQVYGIRAKVRVTGDARLQLAMDYWKGRDSAYNGWTPGCTGSNNCEAWLGDWYGDTGGKFVTIVSPRTLLGNSH